MLFFFQAPYFSATSWSESASRGKLSLCFLANLALLGTSSTLTPSTAALLFPKSGKRSRNAHASFVQPGVSSFG
jgi:hypothetical protein